MGHMYDILKTPHKTKLLLLGRLLAGWLWLILDLYKIPTFPAQNFSTCGWIWHAYHTVMSSHITFHPHLLCLSELPLFFYTQNQLLSAELPSDSWTEWTDFT